MMMMTIMMMMMMKDCRIRCNGFLKIMMSWSAKLLFVVLLMFLFDDAGINAATSDEATWNQSDQTFTAYTCEENELKISCSGNKTINVTYANYGRENLDICNDQKKEEFEMKWNLRCITENSLEIVKRKCANISEGEICKVRASNNVFTDPCQQTPKYLKAKWQCQPVDYENVATDYDDGHRQRLTTTAVVNSNERLCPSELLRSVRWPATNRGSSAVQPCPNNSNLTKAIRRCGLNPVQWLKYPDLSQCVSQQIMNMLDTMRKLNERFVLATLDKLLDDVVRVSRDDGNLLFGGDVTTMTLILLETVDLTDDVSRGDDGNVITEDAANKVNKAVVSATSNLLSENVEDSWKDLTETIQAETATRVMSAVEKSAMLLANSASDAKSTERNTSNLVIQVDVLGVNEAKEDAIFPKPSSNKSQQQQQAASQDTIRIAKEDIEANAIEGLTRVVFVKYKNVGKWLKSDSIETEKSESIMTTEAIIQSTMKRDTTAAAAAAQEDDEPEARLIVNTDVIAATLKTNSSTTKLQKPVQFTLQHKQKENVFNPICVYWKYSKKTFQGRWSKDGCRLISNYSSHTVCECDHLTNFAVLMSISSHQMSDIHKFTLSLITYFGCMISIICLALAFITFFWFKNLQCDRNTIHKNLVLSLFIAEVIFLLGIVQYEKAVLCSVVAAVLHYFFLTSFAWMALEGVQLYVLLIEVFEAEKSRVKWYYMAGYGLPAIIVCISAAADHTGYGSSYHCWLKIENGFIWAFVGPAIVIIVANSVMLVVAIYMMWRHSTTVATWKMKEKTKLETIGAWIKGAIVLMVLLGSTWTFGLFYINQDLLFMAYIFTIFNSLQGLFIFVFHCLTIEKVQKEYKRFIQHSTWLPESFRARWGTSGSGAISTAPNQSTSSGANVSMFRFFKSRKRNPSLSSSSFQKSPGHSKKDKVMIVISPPGEGSSPRKGKRPISSSSESGRLTDSSGILQSPHDNNYEASYSEENTEDASGYLDQVLTHVDENEFNIPEFSEMEGSVVYMDYEGKRKPDYQEQQTSLVS